MVIRVLAMGVAFILATVQPGLARSFTADDLARLDRVSDPQLSPDGRLIAFNVRSTDWEANRGVNALWVMERGVEGALPHLIREQEKTATVPHWSQDGHWLYFLSSRSGSIQVWRTAADDVAPRQMTALPIDVSAYRLAADGRALVAAMDVFADCASLACSKERLEAKAKEKATGQLYDGGPAVFWDQYLDGRHINLFAVELTADKPATEAVAITPGFETDIVARPDGDLSSFVISPADRTVIFSAAPSGSAQGMGEPKSLYLVPMDGGAKPMRLGEGSPDQSRGVPVFSHDGTRLAFLSWAGEAFTAPRARIVVRDLETTIERELAPAFALSPHRIAWADDDRTLYALVEDAGQERIFAFDTITGAVRPLTDDGHVASLSSAGGIIVFSRDTLDQPAQLFELASDGVVRQLTHVGLDRLAQTPLSAFERFSFAGWNGEPVQGYIVKPNDFQPGRKYPVAFLIHGGPHGSFGNTWSYRWNPQVWAGMGYAVVMIDFHGSSGYGEAFAKSIVGHWGDLPLEDLQKGWAFALSRYDFLDGDRACALGGSYGGYMVTWIAGKWASPWKCLVDHDGVFDVRLLSYSTDIPAFMQQQDGGETWEQPEVAERFNPIDWAGAWRVPILVIHSGHDYRVSPDQGLAAYGAAHLRHVPSQLLYFPDENHWVLKPQNSVQWYAVIQTWMNTWLKN